jgi:DNA-binding IclR family transcriptional regulator
MPRVASPTTEPNYPIGSVDSALRLILLLAERKTLRISEASSEIDVARSTAHRLMKMLEHYGFAAQDEASKAYTAGPVLVNIGLRVIRAFDVRTVARPLLQDLRAEVNETVNLWVLQQSDILCLDSVESTKALRVGSRTGTLMAAYATAAGRSLLANLSRDALRALYPSSRLPRLTGSTLDTRKRLEEELERCRELGYAVQRGETEIDVAAIAAAVQDRHGQASFSVSVAVPLSRVEEHIDQFGASVRRTADRLAELLPW